MNPPSAHPGPLPAPPWVGFRGRLLAQADQLSAAGDAAGAAVLRAMVEAWWREQEGWNAVARDVLRANHEINNALVGVSGNAQLLLLGPAGQQTAFRERLQIVLRESERIERAVHRMQTLRSVFDPARDAGEGRAHGFDTANAA
jgi:signal transduction histidine kinase